MVEPSVVEQQPLIEHIVSGKPKCLFYTYHKRYRRGENSPKKCVLQKVLSLLKIAFMKSLSEADIKEILALDLILTKK
jgi:hypothetical protein